MVAGEKKASLPECWFPSSFAGVSLPSSEMEDHVGEFVFSCGAGGVILTLNPKKSNL